MHVVGVKCRILGKSGPFGNTTLTRLPVNVLGQITATFTSPWYFNRLELWLVFYPPLPHAYITSSLLIKSNTVFWGYSGTDLKPEERKGGIWQL